LLDEPYGQPQTIDVRDGVLTSVGTNGNGTSHLYTNGDSVLAGAREPGTNGTHDPAAPSTENETF
jgi:hypothetical protein